VILFFAMVSSIIIRELFDKYSNSQKTIEYLNMTEKQLVSFNNRLQQIARKRGEEMVKEDRLKFTRDLHDTCGYAFTNIILVSDAAVSHNEMDIDDTQELFHKIRNLASQGLQETREILHFIRKIQMPYTHTIDTIFQIKSIFEDVTGIKVEVIWGNMNQNYDSEINKVIVRIIQEAFTNSIRHGQASFIQIQFWESYGELVMTITDNGKGSKSIVKGIGLAGMEERLHLVNGKLSFSAPPMGGFRLTAVIPVIKGIVHERSKT
jgi:signal transduction histidine kinase